MKYLDTSIIVSALTTEDTTPRSIAWLRENRTAQLCTSLWLLTELSGALARKIRMNRMTTAGRDQAMSRFYAAILPTTIILPIEVAVFRRATDIVQQFDAGIRAGDALHLAIASTNGAILCTFDKPFAAGAIALGYNVELIA